MTAHKVQGVTEHKKWVMGGDHNIHTIGTAQPKMVSLNLSAAPLLNIFWMWKLMSKYNTEASQTAKITDLNSAVLLLYKRVATRYELH